MSIYKDKDRYIVKVCINGRQILRRKYLGRIIATKQMALDCERDLFLQYSDEQKDYEINDLFNLFEEYLFKKYKETPAKRYLNSFNYVIKKYFVKKKISNITRSYCEFLNDSINNLSYSGIEIYIFLVKTFINFLSLYGLKINSSVFYVYKRSSIKKKDYKYYSFKEFLKLIKVIDNSKDKLIFSLLFYYGLRVGELRALQIKDFKKDRISINKELTNKGRFGGQKILDPKTSSSFREYPYVRDIKKLLDVVVIENKLEEDDFIFINKKQNKVIGESSIRRKLDEYSSLAKLKRIKIHEFRHSCATYLINKDIDPKDIASWLGHSSVDTTLRVYSHLLPIRKENIKNIFNKEE